MTTFRNILKTLPYSEFHSDLVCFREIRTEDELGLATCIFQLPPEQQAMVNPAGFSIGRAYLNPDSFIPYLIYKSEIDKIVPIGFILLSEFIETKPSEHTHTSWSYFIIPEHQGRGLGKAAAKLAMRLLCAARPDLPIMLSAEVSNIKAHNLYLELGFKLSDKLDGDDLVFAYNV